VLVQKLVAACPPRGDRGEGGVVRVADLDALGIGRGVETMESAEARARRWGT
jgi:hypothetical protein